MREIDGYFKADERRWRCARAILDALRVDYDPQHVVLRDRRNLLWNVQLAPFSYRYLHLGVDKKALRRDVRQHSLGKAPHDVHEVYGLRPGMTTLRSLPHVAVVPIESVSDGRLFLVVLSAANEVKL